MNLQINRRLFQNFRPLRSNLLWMLTVTILCPIDGQFERTITDATGAPVQGATVTAKSR